MGGLMKVGKLTQVFKELVILRSRSWLCKSPCLPLANVTTELAGRYTALQVFPEIKHDLLSIVPQKLHILTPCWNFMKSLWDGWQSTKKLQEHPDVGGFHSLLQGWGCWPVQSYRWGQWETIHLLSKKKPSDKSWFESKMVKRKS